MSSQPYNWQAGKTSINERVKFLFNNEILSDVHFIVGKGSQRRRIPAHKFVLSVGSAVFDAMFNGGISSPTDDVELPDVESSAFLAMLKFLYTDEIQIGPETVMTTLYTAKKYVIPILENACVDFLKKNLRPDNAFMLLTQARLFDESQLATRCLECIDKNPSESFSAEGFTDIDYETLFAMLKRDTLGLKESQLFQHAVRWAEHECERREITKNPTNERKVLSQALYQIRFPLMPVEDFAAGPAQSGILTDKEIVSLFLYFHVNPKPKVDFLDKPRCCLTGREKSVKRFSKVENRWGYSGTSDRIRFSVNKRIFVVGLGLYGAIHGPSDYNVKMQILNTETGSVCGENDTAFSCDGSQGIFRVMFKEPIELSPVVTYVASATLKGADSYYGTKGQRKVVCDVTDGKDEKIIFHFSYATGNNNGTSVEDGQIPEIIFYT